LGILTTAFALGALGGCGDSTGSQGTGGAGGSGGAANVGGAGGSGGGSGGAGGTAGGGGSGGAPVDKAKDCADTFGDALTAPYGRIDGTVLAVVKPTDTQCAMPNSDHVVVQVVMFGKVYRMVVNIQSNFGDPKVQYLAAPHALPAPVWQEGWHTGVTLDYATDLGVHAADFTPYDLPTLSDEIADAITLGQKISVYSYTSGGASAHKIHRNNTEADGAIFLDPDSASPTMLLFHFADQQF